MTRRQLFAEAYRTARNAGLDTNTSDAVGHRVLDRLMGNVTLGIRAPLTDYERMDITRTINQEVQSHAAP